MIQADLYKLAKTMLNNAYAPYSNFSVGCILVAKSGKIYKGCNIENISYGATCCAERVALFSAIAAGERDFERLILTSSDADFITPCGICRQVYSEFVDPSFTFELLNGSGNVKTVTLSQLLPNQFDSNLVKK